MKKILFILSIVVFTISCKEEKKEIKTEEPVKKEVVAANYQSIETEIEGMTCEIGCARTIQSKLSKVDGIAFAKVDFESKKGVFTYDTNKISKEDITNKINGIAGGDVYTVSKTNDLEEVVK